MTAATDANPARLRFVVKKLSNLDGGRGSTLCVYDLQNGSFPYRNGELGEVTQDHPDTKEGAAAAQAEADRLSAAHGGLSEAKRHKANKQPSSGSFSAEEPGVDAED